MKGMRIRVWKRELGIEEFGRVLSKRE